MPEHVFDDADWTALFTPDSLERFAPKRGDTGDPHPVLEVHVLEDDGTRRVVIMMIAAEDFNDAQTRRLVLRQLGEQCAKDGWRVVAMVYASAAWMRQFSKEEEAQRGSRLVETYDDKEEIMMVHGMTLDARNHLASARILRDKTGRIRAVQPWKVFPSEAEGTQMTSYLLRAAWEGYAAQWLSRPAQNN
jgi:hypothetical protein